MSPEAKMAVFCSSVALGFLHSGLAYEAAAMFRAAALFASRNRGGT